LKGSAVEETLRNTEILKKKKEKRRWIKHLETSVQNAPNLHMQMTPQNDS
jgi:hypothetical protein